MATTKKMQKQRVKHTLEDLPNLMKNKSGRQMSPQWKWSNEQLDLMKNCISLKLSGAYIIRLLKQKFQIPQYSITHKLYAVRRQMGVTIRKNWTPERLATLQRMFNQGKSIEEIMKELDVSAGAVYSRLLLEGVQANSVPNASKRVNQDHQDNLKKFLDLGGKLNKSEKDFLKSQNALKSDEVTKPVVEQPVVEIKTAPEGHKSTNYAVQSHMYNLMTAPVEMVLEADGNQIKLEGNSIEIVKNAVAVAKAFANTVKVFQTYTIEVDTNSL